MRDFVVQSKHGYFGMAVYFGKSRCVADGRVLFVVVWVRKYARDVKTKRRNIATHFLKTRRIPFFMLSPFFI